ncbi:unnamed protein product [Moneuplotes crassus]|uniref:Uncharacterized protein n=1 Tax=Euplotes crassus TaxID=5936 RepID=A0AAD1XYZ7_EUPCR|nr:unnamed protein product [Moneuplotes crassus]
MISKRENQEGNYKRSHKNKIQNKGVLRGREISYTKILSNSSKKPHLMLKNNFMRRLNHLKTNNNLELQPNPQQSFIEDCMNNYIVTQSRKNKDRPKISKLQSPTAEQSSISSRRGLGKEAEPIQKTPRVPYNQDIIGFMKK